MKKVNIYFYQTFVTKSEDNNRWINTVISIIPSVTIEISKKKKIAIVLHWLGFGFVIDNFEK